MRDGDEVHVDTVAEMFPTKWVYSTILTAGRWSVQFDVPSTEADFQEYVRLRAKAS